ncbi:hypothetical protein [uncultured Gilliamella sp.]|uniref:hypothetical protein n=1 Tax=uncultured Gilliamella sp. TaxID=1193505 RepID=UPI0025D21613|nr:hypothetical protein [uncultured Gilliamella sp.]
MKISNTIFEKTKPFDDLAPGDTFIHNGDICIKALGRVEGFCAVRLINGNIVQGIKLSDAVEPIKLEVIPLIDRDEE